MNDKSQPGTEKMPESPLSDPSDQFHFEDSIFEYIVQKVPVSLYIMSQTNFIYVNDCLCEMLDYPEEDFLSGKLGLTDIIHPEDLPKVRKRFFHLSKGTTQKARYRVRVIKRDGSLLHAEINSTTSSLDGKQVFLGSVSDITEEVLANDRLKDSEERFNSLFYENPDAIFSFDLEGNFIDVNPGSLKLSGYSHQELMEMSFMPMIIPEHLDKALYYFAESLKGNTNRYEIDLYGKNGELINLEVTNFPMQQAGQITGVYGIGKDVTSRNEHKKLLEEMAFFDHLTKLPNRKLFEDRLEQALKLSYESNTAPAVLFLNMDRFKYINDLLGYEHGDLFLKQTSQRMVECVAESATVGRFAGDEFAVLLPDTTTESAIECAKRLNSTLAEPIEVMGQQLSLTASIGIACADDSNGNLIKQAEAAMLYTKKHSKNSFSLFSHELNKEIADKLTIERELKSAIRNDEFLIHYQPIMDLAAGKISAMEALIRWNHPELGMVPPDQFIPVSEESGQIIAIGKWVLYTACSQTKQWQQQGYAPFRICVNISTIQLQHPNFVQLVKGILEETGLEAKWLELEVTESILLEDTETLKESLLSLKALGISMSIDDFGTGFTSLNYLRQFSFDRVKIDRSFVQDINQDLSGKAITSTIIALAHKLGMEVVAEGIEDSVQLSYLVNELCNEGQGYYFCRPKSADQHDLLIMDK
ncbi:sensor domain-containing protein [Planomicrobium okeanokoites]|uniref:sensor domain-containing protein n=1 Tax=Planomicrobium okeanokoites TaxID=244 RepID=UPI00248FF5E8|nr:EAL domain-containing protein [Planomicrobium okeanokoites]